MVLVDELAHTNIDGSGHSKRYEDVMDLLAAKIDVISTMNVQHIESLAPLVAQISGVTVRETVPDWVMQRVDEIVLADLTPEALQSRMKRGDIYPAGTRRTCACATSSSPGNLIALRELALRQVTQVVDRSLDAIWRKSKSTTHAGRGRTHRGLYQLESGGAVSHCTRIAHGGGYQGRSSLSCMSIWRQDDTPAASAHTGGEHSFRARTWARRWCVKRAKA